MPMFTPNQPIICGFHKQTHTHTQENTIDERKASRNQNQLGGELRQPYHQRTVNNKQTDHFKGLRLIAHHGPVSIGRRK